MNLLQEAENIINGERAKDYGNAGENWERIAGMWAQFLGQTITKEQAIVCMILVKAARLATSPDHRDSWLDIAGYAGVWDKTTRGE